jgi:hypothetical protein
MRWSAEARAVFPILERVVRQPGLNANLILGTDNTETSMLKFLGGTIGVIFLIGLLVVIALLALIF